MDLICAQSDCRVLPRMCCKECVDSLHNTHTIEPIEQFFLRQNERFKRKYGIHQTHMNEVGQLIKNYSNTRKKSYKWAIKMYKKVENECRVMEKYTIEKIDA
jgi:hypothetical protein